MMQRSRVAGWTSVLILLALLAAWLLRSEVRNSSPRGTTPSTGTQELSVLGTPGDPAPAPPVAPPAPDRTPAPAAGRPKSGVVLEVRVSDIFGIPVKEPLISINLPGPAGASIEKGDEGHHRFRVYQPQGEVRVECGDFEGAFSWGPGVNELNVPGTDGMRFGELSILPREWESVRIRVKGDSKWKTPTAVDAEHGRRFLFLHPGIYEIADSNGMATGRVSVTAGKRTTHALERLAGLKIQFKWLNFTDSKSRPGTTRVTITGRSEGASYQEGHQLVLETLTKETSMMDFGLEPGLYEVVSADHAPRFTQAVDLRGGEIKIVEIQHWLK